MCSRKSKKWTALIRGVLGIALALSLAAPACAEESPAGNALPNTQAAGYANDEDIAAARAPQVTFSDADKKHIVEVKILKGGSGGEVLTSLTDAEPKALLLERGEEYTLSVSVHKTFTTNTEGYVRLRFGNEDAAGNVTYNGLIFKNPPGSRYTVGEFSGHSSLDKVEVRTDAANPIYGTKPSSYPLQDGVFIYHEKTELPSGNEVTFYMQFSVDDVGYDGSGWLTDGLQLQTGTMQGDVFTPEATLTATLPVEPKPGLKGTFNGTTKTATLGGNGQILTYYTQENNNSSEYLGMVYQTNEFDIVYPTGAEIGDFGFDTAYNKSSSTRGTVEKSGKPQDNEDGTTTQHFITRLGYKERTSDPAYYYYLTFPADKFTDGQEVTTTLNNMSYTYLTGKDETITVEVTEPATKVKYTIVDPTKDSTTLTAVNRTTGDGVYNITGVTDTASQLLTSFSGCRITNTVSTSTPFEKTYEAQFNTTNTAAVISYITVPLGDAETPQIWLTGKDAATGAEKTIHLNELEDATLSNPLNNRLNARYSMAFRAEDYGFSTFTAVKAEIGKLVGGTDTCSWSSNFDLGANLSGAYGRFTTDEPGIVVKNTYRLYNTEPDYQQYGQGDLAVTTQTTSSTEARVSYNGSVSGIYNKAGSAVTDVFAGDEVTIKGTVYPYQVPYTAGYVKGTNGVTENIYANTSFVADPVLYVTLPAGMTLNTENLKFRVNEYSYRNDKTTYKYSNKNDFTYTVENITYMNQSSTDANLYKITFPGMALGYMAEGTDGTGTATMLRKQLYYEITLKTSKGLETKNYQIADLLGISSANPVTAMPYRNNTTLCAIVQDKNNYGINGGRDYAALVTENKRSTGFALQQQAEVNINNAVTVVAGSTGAEGEWLSYEPTDPNSVLMMGRQTTGKYKLKVTNTGTVDSTDVSIIVPLPKKSETLGAAFMYGDNAENEKFAFTMDVSWDNDALAGFDAQYVQLEENINQWNQTVTPVCTPCDAAVANAILLTRATAEAGQSYDITLNYTVDTSEDLPNKLNRFRNIFRYTTGGTTYSGLGSYVACEIAEGRLSGTAFYDENRNGVQDAGESALPGVSVMTKDAQGKILSTTTDADGKYLFSAIREEQISVTYALGTGNDDYRFNVAAEGLTPAADKKSATAYYPSLDDAVMNIPLSYYWTLSYDANGATSGLVPATQEYDPGNAVATVRVKPDNLYRKYYAFNGWNTAADGSGTAYQPNAQFTMTDSLTLYAQWVYGTYTATINYQGGSSTSGKTGFTVVYGEKFWDKLPAGNTITRLGYTFNGWAGNLTTTGRYNTGSTWNMEDGTVYARYTEKTGYTVEYDTAGGSAITAQENLKWTAQVIPAAEPTKTGYEFDCWTYDGQEVPAGATYASLAKTDDTANSIKLTAKYTAKAGFTVKYDLNTAALPQGSTVNPASYTSLTNVAWTQAGLLPSQAPSCAGYAFGGWYYSDNPDAVSTTATYGSLVGETKGEDGSELKEITLTAKWTKVTGQLVHYNTNGGTAVNDKVVNGLDSFGLIPDSGATTKPGSSFVNWTYTKDKGTDNEKKIVVDADTVYSSLSTGDSITLDANWTPKNYTIKYDYGEIDDVTDKLWQDSGLIPTDEQDVATLVKTGYTFAGWTYKGMAVTTTTTISSLIPADDATDNTLTLTATWAEKTYSVVYDSAGGTAVSTQTGIAYTAASLVPAARPTKTGYDFTGWQYGTTPVGSATTIKDLIAGLDNAGSITSVTLTAAYSPKTGYTVKYDTVGGTAITDRGGIAWNETKLWPTEKTTRTGYTFKNWRGGRITNVLETTSYADIAEGDDVTGYITLVAEWSIDSYTITAKDADGTEGGAAFSGSYVPGTLVPASHTYGTATALPTPYKDRYDFAGWYTDYTCQNRVTVLGAQDYTGDITIYAKWIEKTNITGLVKMVYEYTTTDGKNITQTWQQKTKEIDLTLQRKAEGETDFAPVGEPCHVTFDVPENTDPETATSAFAFENVPKTDENGNLYEYRVTSNTTNYEVSRGALGGEGSTIYDLTLTYKPDSFNIEMVIDPGKDTIAEADRPVAFRVRIAFRAKAPGTGDGVFADGTKIYTSQELGTDTPATDTARWIYITEHNDASMEIDVGEGGTASAQYSVQKWWDGSASWAYYQFVIDAYKLADGTWVQKSAEDGFTVTYSETSVNYIDDKTVPQLHVAINRKNAVSFELNGGTAVGDGVETDGTLKPQTVLGGGFVTDPENNTITTSITKTGYTLEGWYTDAECTEANKWDFATKVTTDVKLYAKWKPETYTITLVDGEGETDKRNITATYDAALPQITLPTREGKAFGGYFTEQDGKGICYYDATGAAKIDTFTETAVKELYAKWTDKITISGTATIKYTYGEGSEVPTAERWSGATINLQRRLATADDTVPYEDVLGTDGNAITQDVTFNVADDGETGSIAYNFTGLDPADSNGSKYQYRVYSELLNYTTAVAFDEKDANVCNLVFDFNPISFQLPVEVDTTAIPEGERPTAVNVAVAYRPNPSSSAPSGDYEGDWPAVGQLNGGTIRLDISAAGMGTATYPVWKQTTVDNTVYQSYYQINVVSYEYSGADGETQTVPAADAPYYVMAYGSYGTYTQDAEGKDVITGVSATLDRTYKVSFNTQSLGDPVPMDQKVPRGSYAQEPENDKIIESGYYISGWYTDAECTDGNKWNFAENAVVKDTTLYAKWEKQDYTITFYDSAVDVNGGAVPINSAPVAYLGTLPAITVPVKDSYAFAGYYYADENGETCYYDAQAVPQKEQYDTPQNISLYAKWVEKTAISGKVKINYTYTAGTQQNPTTQTMPQAQRLGAVQVSLQRSLGENPPETVATQETIFLDERQEYGVGDFNFESLPKTDADGESYTYSVVAQAANYDAAYGVEIDGVKSEYNIELSSNPITFYLPMEVDAASIASGAPVSVDVKVAFIWYTPTTAFNGIVDGNPYATGGAPNPKKWRYLPEFIPEKADMPAGTDMMVQNLPLENGKASLIYPVTSEGIRNNDPNVTGEDKDKVVPYYYQFVVTAYRMADGSIISAGSAEDPFVRSWQQWYAFDDTENEANRALTITLSRKWAASYTLQNVTADAQPDTLLSGQNYTISLTPQAGFALPDSITVTAGGAPCTNGVEYAYDKTAGTLTIYGAALTGDLAVEITGIAAAQTPWLKPLVSAAYTVGAAEVSALDIGAVVYDGGEVSCQWYRRTGTSGDYQKLDGQTAATLVPDVSAEGVYQYYCEVTNRLPNGSTATATSIDSPATITVVPQGETPPVAAMPPLIITDPQGAEYTLGDAIAPLTVEAQTQDGGRIEYQWFAMREGDPAGYQPIAGANSSSYTPAFDAAGSWRYYCEVSNTITGDNLASPTARANSSAALITIKAAPLPQPEAEQPTVLTQPTGAAYPQNAPTADLWVEGAAGDGGVISYQWYQSIDGTNANGTLLEGQTGQGYNPSSAVAGSFGYYCVITNTLTLDDGTVKTAWVATDVAIVTITPPQLCTVTFDANDGSGIVADYTKADIAPGSLIENPGEIKRPGYVMTGWYINAACTKQWSFGTDTVTQSMTLYAGWRTCTHEFGEWIVVKPATETEDGQEMRECGICGMVEYRIIPKLQPTPTPAAEQPTPTPADAQPTPTPATGQPTATPADAQPTPTPAAGQPTPAPATAQPTATAAPAVIQPTLTPPPAAGAPPADAQAPAAEEPQPTATPTAAPAADIPRTADDTSPALLAALLAASAAACALTARKKRKLSVKKRK